MDQAWSKRAQSFFYYIGKKTKISNDFKDNLIFNQAKIISSTSETGSANQFQLITVIPRFKTSLKLKE